MPSWFGRKKDQANESAAPEAPGGDSRAPRSVRFIGYTEDWRLEGAMQLTGRLLDTLNRRDAIPLADVTWAPLDGSAAMEPAPGIQSVDPYDLIVVVAGEDTLAAVTAEEHAARVHRITFDVALEAPPFRVVGTISLHPGSNPESLLERGTQMFAAVKNAVVKVGDGLIDLGGAEVVLVNRFYLRDVAQVDRATGLRYEPFPGYRQGIG